MVRKMEMGKRERWRKKDKEIYRRMKDIVGIPGKTSDCAICVNRWSEFAE